MLYNDFKKIKNYSVFINNMEWFFSFSECRICIHNKEDLNIENDSILVYNVSEYDNYYETFKKVINDIKDFIYCSDCDSYNINYCKICKLNKEIDKLNIDFEDNCPICMDKLTIRYLFICNDERHKICSKCGKNNLDKCPLCRQTRSIEIIDNQNEDII